MSKTDAEYMRAYRARRKAAAEPPIGALARSMVRIIELEAEVKHLKAELAKRAEERQSVAIALNRTNSERAEAEASVRILSAERESFGTYRPVPKPAPKHR